MQITQEQFNEVHGWTIITIPPEDWPNPRANQYERTFYVATAPRNVTQYTLRRNEFMRLAYHGIQTTT